MGATGTLWRENRQCLSTISAQNSPKGKKKTKNDERSIEDRTIEFILSLQEEGTKSCGHNWRKVKQHNKHNFVCLKCGLRLDQQTADTLLKKTKLIVEILLMSHEDTVRKSTRTSLPSLKVKDMQEGRLEAVENEIEALKNTIREKDKRTNERIDDLSKNIEVKFGRMEGKLDETAREQNDKFNRLEEKLDGSVEAANKYQQSLNDKLEKLQKQGEEEPLKIAEILKRELQMDDGQRTTTQNEQGSQGYQNTNGNPQQQNEAGRSYANAARTQGREQQGTSEGTKQKLADFSKMVAIDHDKEDVTALYLRFYRQGPLGEIRRTIIRECLGGRREMLLNFNAHPTRGSIVSQFIIPKAHESEIRAALLSHEDIEDLPSDYDPLDLPPDCKRRGQRREAAIDEHLVEAIRSWRTTANRHRSQGVYDLLIAEAERAEAALKKRAESKKEKSTAKQTRNTPGEGPSSEQNREGEQDDQQTRAGTRPRSPGNTPSRRTRQRMDTDMDLPSPRTFEAANILVYNQDPIQQVDSEGEIEMTDEQPPQPQQ